MIELLQRYSVEEILIFIALLAAAGKGTYDFFSWLNTILKKKYSKEEKIETSEERLIIQIEGIKESFVSSIEALQNQIKLIDEKTDSLAIIKDSLLHDIKMTITEKHHYFCYELGYIDDLSLDCLEHLYADYEKLGGNSFVLGLMDEIRALPKISATKKPNEKRED